MTLEKKKYINEIGYEKLKIPNTRFKILYKDIYFDIL